MRKLGIIAGGGSLPGDVVRACQKQKRPFFVAALKGFCEADKLPRGIPVVWVRLGAAGRIEKAFKAEKVQDVMMIGSVRRPSLRELYPDWTALCFMLRILKHALGDDKLLRHVIREIERHGWRVIGIQDVLPSVFVPAGVLGGVKPSKGDMRDIRRGFEVAKALGNVDVGQAVIVQQGIVLAVEGIEGTAELIKRSKALRRKGGGGVLVKVKKPRQETRVDLPGIGSKTIQQAYDAGLSGVAVEAGGTLIADAAQAVRLADKLGVFVLGVDKTAISDS